MTQEQSIPALRSRVAALVQEEALLLAQACELSRSAAQAHDVDPFFSQVATIQRERREVERQLAQALGTHRLHVASELWKPGVYRYRPDLSTPEVEVQVSKGPAGLQAHIPGKAQPVRVDVLDGVFDGPFATERVRDPAHA